MEINKKEDENLVLLLENNEIFLYRKEKEIYYVK